MHMHHKILHYQDAGIRVIPLVVRDELWFVTIVVTAVLVGDIISTYMSRRETQTS
ncbi:MAG: hypothetical protein R6V83_07730 [Candidatus Thorarchaeota archaeon]